MTDGLGHQRYLTYGEDVGTWISDRLAADFPGAVAGLFATHAAFAPASRKKDLSEEETAWLNWLAKKWEDSDAYSRVQSRRPDILAAALLDSPCGLAAWIIEKLLSWSGNEPERYWSDNDLLTTVTLYWLTGTIGTSFRAYSDDRHEIEIPQIHVPVRVNVQHGERGFPRSYAARTYLDIRSWEELPDGGHFPAWQNAPDVAAGIVELEKTFADARHDAAAMVARLGLRMSAATARRTRTTSSSGRPSRVCPVQVSARRGRPGARTVHGPPIPVRMRAPRGTRGARRSGGCERCRR
jgi:pimeloyl-ACP methyl ester carboxylesterase